MRDVPGKLLLVLSGQISASGLFLFSKNTDNIFLPLCSDMTMCVHEALPYPSKGGCRSMLAYGAISTQTVGRTSPSRVVAVDDGTTREEKGPHTILLWYLDPSSLTISIIKHQCPQGPCLSSQRAFYGYGQKIPIKLRPHHSILLRGPRPVFPV